MNISVKLFISLLAFGLVACSINPVTYQQLPDGIGGKVEGLQGMGLVLTNNGGDELAVSSNGAFVFPAPAQRGAAYSVAVKTQPSNPTQVCSVTNGSGTTVDSDVSDVQVSCNTTSFHVSGSVTGLSGAGLVLQDNAGDDIAISADGNFTFATPIASGAGYDVRVLAQPSQPVQTCTVTSGAGTIGDADVNVAITCATDRFTIGGTVSGLAGAGLVLEDNAGDDLAITADGTFTFATPVASGAGYDVRVLAQPSQPTQTCTVTSGAGTIGAASVSDVAITCVTDRFTIGGTVTGLVGAGLVLQNNDGDDVAIRANGTFTFATSIASGASFKVTVAAQPSQPTQTCSVMGGSGTVGGGNVTSVAINCETTRFLIGGTVSGLAGSVTLQNNGGDDLALTANGELSFATAVASGSPYVVTVASDPSSPISQKCTVSNGSGTVGNANVTNVVVTCATNRFTIGGTVVGLAAGDTITLRDSVGNALLRSANGSFTFATPIASGQPYSVTTDSPTAPISQSCTVTNGSGTVGNSNISNIVVTCTTNRFSVGGTITGLAAGDSITLTDNGGDPIVRSGNGSFSFAASLASGQTYNVATTSPTSPVRQTCRVTNGSGTIGNANINNVVVTCQSYFLVMVNDATGHLERLDPVTLAVTDIGPVGVPTSFGDCMFNPSDGKVYMVDGRGNRGLYTLNLTTGAATLIGIHGNSAMEGIAYHPPSGNIYGTSQDDISLFILSPTTGAASLIAPDGHHLQGLAWDSTRNVMTTFDGTQMFAINVSNAALTLLGTPSDAVGNFGMTYDSFLDRFWVADSAGQLVQYDPANSFATTLKVNIGGSHNCIATVPFVP